MENNKKYRDEFNIMAVRKFADMYCRRPSEKEFIEFCGRDALADIINQYASLYSKLSAYMQFVTEALEGHKVQADISCYTRCYNVYDWHGNFMFHGTYDDIVARNEFSITDIPALPGDKIYRVKSIPAGAQDRTMYLIMQRRYNIDDFVKYLYSGDVTAAILPAIKVVELRKMQLAGKVGRVRNANVAVRKVGSQGVFDVDFGEDTHLIKVAYRRICDEFMDMYCRLPSWGELDKVGIDVQVLKRHGITSGKELARVYGYDYRKSWCTWAVYKDGVEEFRGTPADIQLEYDVEHYQHLAKSTTHNYDIVRVNVDYEHFRNMHKECVF